MRRCLAFILPVLFFVIPAFAADTPLIDTDEIQKTWVLNATVPRGYVTNLSGSTDVLVEDYYIAPEGSRFSQACLGRTVMENEVAFYVVVYRDGNMRAFFRESLDGEWEEGTWIPANKQAWINDFELYGIPVKRQGTEI